MYDESIDIADAEEVNSPVSTSPTGMTSPTPKAKKTDKYFNDNHDEGRTHHESSDQSENSEDDDDVDVQAAMPDGLYDPGEFDHLSVSPDIQELFLNITRYTPQNMEPAYKLRPFVPDFIPAVGDIDAFINIPRPDGKTDSIGLKMVDEPSAKQSEPAVLHLQLRAVAKQTSARSVPIKRVEGAERNAKAVERWVTDIGDLHRSKPPPTVHYTRTMPDVESLMQEWPAPVEQLLLDMDLAPPTLDCSLSQYVDLTSALLDIPTYNSRIQSLHVLFSLYSAIKSSQYLGGVEGQETP